jgi:hypothetical protein
MAPSSGASRFRGRERAGKEGREGDKRRGFVAVEGDSRTSPRWPSGEQEVARQRAQALPRRCLR